MGWNEPSLPQFGACIRRGASRPHSPSLADETGRVPTIPQEVALRPGRGVRHVDPRTNDNAVTPEQAKILIEAFEGALAALRLADRDDPLTMRQGNHRACEAGRARPATIAAC